MNKYFYTLLTAVALLMTVSCSRVEELFSGGSGKTEQVSFAVTAGQVQSRTAGDGNTVDQVHYEVWDKITGQLVVSSITGVNGGAPVEMLKGQASVRLNWCGEYPTTSPSGHIMNKIQLMTSTTGWKTSPSSRR